MERAYDAEHNGISNGRFSYYPEEVPTKLDIILTRRKKDYLERSMKSWIQHRLRLTIHNVVRYYFGNKNNNTTSSSSSSSGTTTTNITAAAAAAAASSGGDVIRGRSSNIKKTTKKKKKETTKVTTLLTTTKKKKSLSSSVTSSLATPFNELDRKYYNKIRPKPWYLISIYVRTFITM